LAIFEKAHAQEHDSRAERHPMAIYTRITCLLIDPIRRQEGVIDVLVGEGMQRSDIIVQGVGK
jgi:hypothetical protein